MDDARPIDINIPPHGSSVKVKSVIHRPELPAGDGNGWIAPEATNGRISGMFTDDKTNIEPFFHRSV